LFQQISAVGRIQMIHRISNSIYSVVYVTVPTMDVGKKIAKSVVEKKLAACVNLIPNLTSIYEWKGTVQEDSEVMLIIKTKTEAIDSLKTEVLSIHPYEVAEFISLPIEQGSEPYMKWIEGQVKNVTVNEEASSQNKT